MVTLFMKKVPHPPQGKYTGGVNPLCSALKMGYEKNIFTWKIRSSGRIGQNSYLGVHQGKQGINRWSGY